jgi:uncharacterized protein YbjT (DUF2867 family)
MILVTGGTGRLGSKVVRALRMRGHDVRALVRKGSSYFWLNDTGCDYFFGDLRDPASLTRAMRGVRGVIAAAGVRVERTENHHGNVTAAGNIALIDAARAHGVERFVLVSCAGVEAAERPGGPQVPALTAKLAAEAHLLASGLDATVLRPGRFVASYADLLRRTEVRGATWLPGRGDARVAPIHVPDVAAMCAGLVTQDDARGEVLVAYGPEILDHAAALQRAAAACGLPSDAWGLPPGALRALSVLARPLGRRWTHALRALEAVSGLDVAQDGHALAARLGVTLTPFDVAAREAFLDRHPDEDPDARETKVVHRQFHAKVYEPGVVKWRDLPEGPVSRGDDN